eukprot:759227-Rhodomonas_salina.1
MHCQGQQLSPGDAGQGATAITVGGVCVVPNTSFGTMLDRGSRTAITISGVAWISLSSHKLQVSPSSS